MQNFINLKDYLAEMQAIKDKLSDLNAMRKAKSEAKEEEKVVIKFGLYKSDIIR